MTIQGEYPTSLTSAALSLLLNLCPWGLSVFHFRPDQAFRHVMNAYSMMLLVVAKVVLAYFVIRVAAYATIVAVPSAFHLA